MQTNNIASEPIRTQKQGTHIIKILINASFYWKRVGVCATLASLLNGAKNILICGEKAWRVARCSHLLGKHTHSSTLSHKEGCALES